MKVSELVANEEFDTNTSVRVFAGGQWNDGGKQVGYFFGGNKEYCPGKVLSSNITYITTDGRSIVVECDAKLEELYSEFVPQTKATKPICIEEQVHALRKHSAVLSGFYEQDLMLQAADTIEAMQRRIDSLEREVEQLNEINLVAKETSEDLNAEAYTRIAEISKSVQRYLALSVHDTYEQIEELCNMGFGKNELVNFMGYTEDELAMYDEGMERER